MTVAGLILRLLTHAPWKTVYAYEGERTGLVVGEDFIPCDEGDDDADLEDEE